MSSPSYPQYTRLSDALERELMLAAIADEQRLSLRDMFKGLFAAIRHGAVAVFHYVAALGDALHQARAKDPRNQYGV